MTANILPTNEATLPNLPAVQAPTTKILPTKCLNIAEPPQIFCPRGQNIRGFRGWRSDSELQCKLQPRKYYPQNVSILLNHHKYFAPRGQNIRGFRGCEDLTTNILPRMKQPCLIYLQCKLQPRKYYPRNVSILLNHHEYFVPPGQNIRGFRGWRYDRKYFTHEWSNLAYIYLQCKLQPRKYYPWNVSILLNHHKYFAPSGQNIRGFRGWRYLTANYLQCKLQPRKYYPRNVSILLNHHKYFAPGAKYSWFSWLKVWPLIFYPRMKRPYLPLPAVQAPTTKILPTKCLNIAEPPQIFCPPGQNIRGFRGWRYDREYFTHEWSNLAYIYLQCKLQPRKYYPRNVSILLNHHKYFAPVGQNIRGFRGWRYDRKYFTHEWSNLAYIYLQCKLQPRKYYPRNVSILLNHHKYFAPVGQNIRGFRGWRYDRKYFTHEWSNLAYIYLQCKLQPRKYYPRNVSILLNHHKYFAPAGQNIRGFRGWRYDRKYFTQNEATLPNLPAVQAPTTKILPTKCLNILLNHHKYFAPDGKYSWLFRGWRYDRKYFTQNEATLPNLPAVQAPTTKYYPQSVSILLNHHQYFAPVGQNIRGFRGWRYDRKYFTHEWSNLA